jgi:hypothetical protein
VKYIPLAAVLILFIGSLYFRWRISLPRQSDLDAIETYARSRGLKISEIHAGADHWRYWLRGNFLLSNVARIYVIEAIAPDGKRMAIHAAIDPMNPGELKVLQESSLSSG